MKKYLRRSLATAFVLLLAASGAIAQTNTNEGYKFNQKRTFVALETCLQNSKVPGFVESALYTVAECKNRYPDLNYSPIIDIVQKIAKDNSDASLRYKAYLVSMYLTHGSDIQLTPVMNAMNHQYLFMQIARQLEQKYLAYDGSSLAAGNR